MKGLKENIYQDAFCLWDFEPTVPSNKYGPSGSLYLCSNKMGHGEYWVHFHENLFAINVYEMFFEEPGVMRYQHAEHLSICLYEDVTNIWASNYHIEPGAVSVYVAQDKQEYRVQFGAKSHIKATSITISPDYYREYLQRRFGTIPDVREAFIKIDGRKDFPELVSVFRRMRDYRGDGMAADLFYEGIVAEVVGLVVKRAADIEAAEKCMTFTQEDALALDGLESYVQQHLDQRLTVEQMARQCCMGLTKFKRSFKNYYGCTPAVFVRRVRMTRAQELLEQTDDCVALVASAVGYRKVDAFSSVFKRFIGVLPGAYRERLRCEAGEKADKE
ncbi:helix-turn-helix domain-containing protein [Atopobium fossor]|uniref:helix-turn-helix domain-containing protein n=1 Tax=Atopobium fossor TaxID=39487 RepID=UPI000687B1A0|nr:AraC family transcriptional regulator [Atopobium fossor]